MGDYLFRVGDYLLSTSIKRGLSGAGLGVFTYAGLDVFVTQTMDSAIQSLQGASHIAVSLMGLSGLDTCLSITVSAILAKIAITQSKLFLDKM